MFVTRDKIRLSDLHYELDELIRNAIFMAAESLDGEEETVITDFDKFYERLMELNVVDIYTWLFSVYTGYVDRFRGAKQYIIIHKDGVDTVRDRVASDPMDDYNERVNREIEHTDWTYKKLEDDAKSYAKYIQEGTKLLYGDDAITKLLYGECIFDSSQDKSEEDKSEEDNSEEDNSTEDSVDITQDDSEEDNYTEETPTEDIKSDEPRQSSIEPKVIKQSFMIERNQVWESIQSGYDVFDVRLKKDQETGNFVHSRTISLNELSVGELKSLLDMDNSNAGIDDAFIAVGYKFDFSE